MRMSSESTQIPFLRSALTAALAVACLWAAGVDARQGGHGQSGGRPGVGSPGGGHGQWGGRHVGGGNGRHVGGGNGWHGGGHRWHGGGHHGHRWHGHHHRWYGYPYWYPAWGVGVALSYPWWGWGYPYDYYYERPAGGVVFEERSFDAAPPRAASPEYLWYCPSPAGYHPDVTACTQPWLRVLPEDVPLNSPPP